MVLLEHLDMLSTELCADLNSCVCCEQNINNKNLRELSSDERHADPVSNCYIDCADIQKMLVFIKAFLMLISVGFPDLPLLL